MSLKGREGAEARCEPSDTMPQIRISHGWYGRTDGRMRFSVAAGAHQGRSVKENVTSSRTSASLLRTSSGSDWKEGTLGGERSDPAGWVTARRGGGRERERAVPAEEVHVLGVFDDAASHHDGLEVLPVDGPQLNVSQRLKSRTELGNTANRKDFCMHPHFYLCLIFIFQKNTPAWTIGAIAITSFTRIHTPIQTLAGTA